MSTTCGIRLRSAWHEHHQWQDPHLRSRHGRDFAASRLLRMDRVLIRRMRTERRLIHECSDYEKLCEGDDPVPKGCGRMADERRTQTGVWHSPRGVCCF